MPPLKNCGGERNSALRDDNKDIIMESNCEANNCEIEVNGAVEECENLVENNEDVPEVSLDWTSKRMLLSLQNFCSKGLWIDIAGVNGGTQKYFQQAFVFLKKLRNCLITYYSAFVWFSQPSCAFRDKT